LLRLAPRVSFSRCFLRNLTHCCRPWIQTKTLEPTPRRVCRACRCHFGGGERPITGSQPDLGYALKFRSEITAGNRPSKLAGSWTCLQCHTAAVVKLFLTAAYSLGSLTFPSVQQAWQFCLLADHLDCPKMLQQCKEHINSSMESAQLSTSKEALDWIMTADKLGLDS